LDGGGDDAAIPAMLTATIAQIQDLRDADRLAISSLMRFIRCCV
jgi:hypothetical protein